MTGLGRDRSPASWWLERKIDQKGTFPIDDHLGFKWCLSLHQIGLDSFNVLRLWHSPCEVCKLRGNFGSGNHVRQNNKYWRGYPGRWRQISTLPQCSYNAVCTLGKSTQFLKPQLLSVESYTFTKYLHACWINHLFHLKWCSLNITEHKLKGKPVKILSKR